MYDLPLSRNLYHIPEDSQIVFFFHIIRLEICYKVPRLHD